MMPRRSFARGLWFPVVGVLIALPCLVESGLFRISRKLYGDIGPAFYGLRTTLLTLLLMALLRIKRPEHLKERDPAQRARPDDRRDRLVPRVTQTEDTGASA